MESELCRGRKGRGEAGRALGLTGWWEELEVPYGGRDKVNTRAGRVFWRPTLGPSGAPLPDTGSFPESHRAPDPTGTRGGLGPLRSPH